ncbi:hypothetical protein EAX61_08730 [Dokdonia sinensis]|uniref:Uncharacterized protein n=1 Tax=Dokdonia sinensis TaxID=2479847 RepID=A0A3M0GPD6_9FLAO|nr:hypothetical protein [Dokdonia sinensis]RMB59136.1 hypothetical protein EAX61_08730 [Dokdonia sinensis]
MSTYRLNTSNTPVILTLELVSPAPGRSYVEVDGTEILTSPDFSGGSIFPSAIGINKELQGKTFKITSILDLSPLTELQKKQALLMTRSSYYLDGGPDGEKLYRLHESRWIRIGDDLFLTKYIDLIS